MGDSARTMVGMPTLIEGKENHLGRLWLDYAEQYMPLGGMALQAWQVIANENPNEAVRMIAELQLVLAPYFEGRAVSHMLFKIKRCDTGAMEMVRDFFQEYFLADARRDVHLLAVKDIAVAAREGRPPPKRVVDYN